MPPKETPPTVNTCGTCRESTVNEAIDNIINAKRNELAELDALYRALPRELSYEANRCLVRLLLNQK